MSRSREPHARFDQSEQIQRARQLCLDVSARGRDRLAALDSRLAEELRTTFFPDAGTNPAAKARIGLFGVSVPWQVVRRAEGWLLRPPSALNEPLVSTGQWMVIAESPHGRGVAVVAREALAAGPSAINLSPESFVVPTGDALALCLARHEVNETVLALETAREYLTHVTRWLAGRTSFGHQLIGHPVIRQRLSLAIVAMAAADAELGRTGADPGARCAAAVSSAARCTRLCEEVHAGAGVFDGRPDTVHRVHVRRMRGVEPTLAQCAPPFATAYPRLAEKLMTVLATQQPAPSRPDNDVASAHRRRLILDLERVCPAAAASLADEIVVAESLAQSLSPGLTARVLTHRQIVRSYLTGPHAAHIAADLLPDIIAGRILTSIAVTEPQVGSDLSGLTATIHGDGQELFLDAVKTYVTGGADCDLVLVAARFGAEIALVWVNAHRSEVHQRRLSSTAWPEARFAELRIHSCPVSERHLHRGSGGDALLTGLAQERMILAGMQLAFARRWMAEVPFRQAGLVYRLSAAQALLQRVLARDFPDQLSMADISMAKVACCTVAADVARARTEALSASSDEHGIDMLIEDEASARASSFAGGTADLNLSIVEGKILPLLAAGNGG